MISINPPIGGLLAQAVELSSHRWGSMFAPLSLHVGFVVDETWSGFLPFSSITNFIPPFLRIHLIHFISPYDGATGLVGILAMQEPLIVYSVR